MPYDLDRQVGGDHAVAQRDEMRAILAVVVADEHLCDPRLEVGGNSIENIGERRRGVVSHDQNADTLF